MYRVSKQLMCGTGYNQVFKKKTPPYVSSTTLQYRSVIAITMLHNKSFQHSAPRNNNHLYLLAQLKVDWGEGSLDLAGLVLSYSWAGVCTPCPRAPCSGLAPVTSGQASRHSQNSEDLAEPSVLAEERVPTIPGFGEVMASGT